MNGFAASKFGIVVAAVCISLPSAAVAQWTIGPFSRPASSPVITPDPKATFTDPILKQEVNWQALHTFNPAAIVRDEKIYVLFRAEDNSGAMQIGMHTSRLGLASSPDGVHFKEEPAPVFFPADDDQRSREWPGGVEDPRIVESADGPADARYVMTYTQWNRQTYSIGIAASPDLIHWKKYGPAFLGSASHRYDALKYKSGGILTTLTGSKDIGIKVVAARVKGMYWMYWGEGAIHLATSPDLIHWTPVEDAKTLVPVEVLRRRPGHFDSGFPEVGPPPLLYKNSIVMLYNGKNDPEHGDPALGANAYAAGEARFSASAPAKLEERTEAPVLKPEEAWEKTGQYVAGTTFAEGLVVFRGKWFLYYGCADSAVGVATAPFTQQ